MKHQVGIFILVALWTLLVAPATCGGGLLAHACAEESGAACHHENDCPADPCNVAHDVTAVAKTVVKADLTITVLTPSGAHLVLAPAHPAATATPTLAALPLPAAALPLLC